MKKVDVIIKYLLWGFIFLNGVIYFLNAQKLAIQQAFFSKYKNYQYIGEDDLVCITHIFAVVVELANSILNTQLVLNVIVLILFYIYIGYLYLFKDKLRYGWQKKEYRSIYSYEQYWRRTC